MASRSTRPLLRHRLRTTATALLQHVRDRWSIENSWHWLRDVPLREHAHRYRGNNGVQILDMLRRLAVNVLRWK
ncbi:transposase [Synechococcus sp. HK01-R]|uniref:transposase n=1 Tax=Synechococcus sp. HK01-R TaxID=2751171 RepID=UPI002107C4BC|nr:transposase [Synechococcus sp. HK01-R]